MNDGNIQSAKLAADSLLAVDPEAVRAVLHADPLLLKAVREKLLPLLNEVQGPKFRATAWEGSEQIIEMDGAPIGGTLSAGDAKVVEAWLKGAWPEIAGRLRAAHLSGEVR